MYKPDGFRSYSSIGRPDKLSFIFKAICFLKPPSPKCILFSLIVRNPLRQRVLRKYPPRPVSEKGYNKWASFAY